MIEKCLEFAGLFITLDSPHAHSISFTRSFHIFEALIPYL